VFERFLSEERVSVPDIDIDFQADRREEVIQYVYSRYGPKHTAMACTFVTFRTRSAIRDVGKALGYSPLLIDQLIVKRDIDGAKVPQHAQLWDLCHQLDGFPRHLGIHNGGMVITGMPMSQRVPTEPATMPNRVVVQWDKDMLETTGMVKIDILGLRMLSAIAEAVSIIENSVGERPELSKLTFDDPTIYLMMTEADTVGIFQVESRAQAQVLPRLRPQTFNDVIVSISLIRPGPIQGNMVHPYLRRRTGHEPVAYPHELLESALEETLGVILFQEQVLKVARDMAGFAEGQGEQLRRALGNKRAYEAIETFHQLFIEGAVENDVLAPIAEAVFNSLKAFGGYSFPKSHAAAFAVLVYQSAWLKHYYPAAFYTALLNNQPMGFWSPAVIVNDARRHSIPIRRVDIHHSMSKCSVENGAIRLGFNYVSGLGEVKAKQVEITRSEGLFTDLADFYQRTCLPRRVVENLILVGAMDEWGIPRRKLLWEVSQLNDRPGGLNFTFSEDGVHLAELSPAETMAAEREILGLLANQHVVSLYGEWMKRHGILGSNELSQRRVGQMVRVAGQNVMHQAPPTAKGFHFITLEDENGFINVIVRPQVYARYRKSIRHLPILIVEGKVQREGAVTNVVCYRAMAMPA
jgi:error-prone DNA polymerase